MRRLWSLPPCPEARHSAPRAGWEVASCLHHYRDLHLTRQKRLPVPGKTRDAGRRDSYPCMPWGRMPRPLPQTQIETLLNTACIFMIYQFSGNASTKRLTSHGRRRFCSSHRQSGYRTTLFTLAAPEKFRYVSYVIHVPAIRMLRRNAEGRATFDVQANACAPRDPASASGYSFFSDGILECCQRLPRTGVPAEQL